MQVTARVKHMGAAALQALYAVNIDASSLTVNETKPEFEGDYTIVTFAFVKQLRKSPDAVGKEMGEWILQHFADTVASFNVIKGFLNLTIHDDYWLSILQFSGQHDFGKHTANGKKVMVEYASPNTNKPLHLGHLRNIFLGCSMSELFAWNGYDVMKTCIVNDRGVHICKSMLSWQKFGNGATPQSTGIKGDHFVGDYYVKFENALRIEAQPIYDALVANDTALLSNADDITKATALALKLADNSLDAEKQNEVKAELKEIARNATPLMQEVRQMLRQWEEGDEETLAIWRMMNGWVYDGFAVTYKRVGSSFDKTYYESDTYLLGKEYIEQGLSSGVFFKKPDGSVWIDLADEGLDEKLVLRRDGTSVYITQDLGLAKLKFEDYPMDESIYVIGDEQNYHMQVLRAICHKLGMPFADGIHHLSYGMVELPGGRMKSREGTVVDADDLCDEMEKVAAAKTEELGKVEGFTADELNRLHHILGVGALKFYLLRVDAKRRMIFNPEESIDFHGFTGPFVQYTYARIRSVLRKADADQTLPAFTDGGALLPLEKQLLVKLEQWPDVLAESCREMNPSLVAMYVFNLAKLYNSFYAEHSVAYAESDEKRVLRLHLCSLCANAIRNAMQVLGIEVPERM